MLNGLSFFSLSHLLVSTRVEKRMWLPMPFLGGILYFLFWKLSYLISMLFRSYEKGSRFPINFARGAQGRTFFYRREVFVQGKQALYSSGAMERAAGPIGLWRCLGWSL